MRGLLTIMATVALLFAGASLTSAQEGASTQTGTQGGGSDKRDDTGDVSGVVTDGDGNPIPNTDVYLKEDEASEENVADATTELDGSFRMEDVDAGIYVLVVGKSGFEALVQKGVPVIAGQEIQLRLVVQSVVLGTAPTGRPRQ